MRLWAEQLLPKLPRQQLLGQHRECCALRGLGWGKQHSVVNYVFTHPPTYLYVYHQRVMLEMAKRHYTVNSLWFDPLYRGLQCVKWDPHVMADLTAVFARYPVFAEHNIAYLNECVANLANKGQVMEL